MQVVVKGSLIWSVSPDGLVLVDTDSIVLVVGRVSLVADT